MSIDVYTETCLWDTIYKPYIPIRRGIVRDALGEFDPQAFLSTKLGYSILPMGSKRLEERLGGVVEDVDVPTS